MNVGIPKLPHHGSERDVKLEYDQSIHAKHYVISANGKFDNPDLPTLKMISAARKGDDDNFTIRLTNPTNEFELCNIGKGSPSLLRFGEKGESEVSCQSVEVGGFVYCY